MIHVWAEMCIQNGGAINITVSTQVLDQVYSFSLKKSNVYLFRFHSKLSQKHLKNAIFTIGIVSFLDYKSCFLIYRALERKTFLPFAEVFIISFRRKNEFLKIQIVLTQSLI